MQTRAALFHAPGEPFEGSGVVEWAGASVTTLHPGDEVVLAGSGARVLVTFP